MSHRWERSDISSSEIPPRTDPNDDKGIREYLWISYYLFVLISSLVGDSIILAASIQPNGIRLNKFIVTVMQHIAVSDLISCFVFVLPTTIVYIDTKMVLGSTLENILGYADEVILGVNTILITLLSITKFLMLTYPSLAPRWTIKRAHITCIVFWLFANVFPAIFLVFEYQASLRFKTSWLKYLHLFRIGITLVLPTLIMIVTTILILCYLVKARKIAKRSGGRTQIRGVATVTITAIIYCISVVPFAWVDIYRFMESKADVYLLLDISNGLSALNIMCNIYVYYLTIPSLREFIRVKILRLEA